MTATTQPRLLTSKELHDHLPAISTNPDHVPGYKNLLDYLSGLHETIAALKQVGEITADPVFTTLATTLTNAGRAAVTELNGRLSPETTPNTPPVPTTDTQTPENEQTPTQPTPTA